MADILAYGNFKCIFLNGNDRIPILISLKYVSWSPIDNNKPVLVQVWVGAERRQIIALNNADPLRRSIYASLALNELIPFQFVSAYKRNMPIVNIYNHCAN